MRDAVRDVQTWYPQIYLACHLDHRRARATRSGISDRDSSVLAHLDERVPTTAAALARHVRVGAPAMSAALKRLAARGYIVRQQDTADGRRQQLRLTAAGARAMTETSVLDAGRVRSLLRRLSSADRQRALNGLALLAEAARAMADGRRR